MKSGDVRSCSAHRPFLYDAAEHADDLRSARRHSSNDMPPRFWHSSVWPAIPMKSAIGARGEAEGGGGW